MPVLQPAQGASSVAPSTYSQPSRKGKKAWRKNVDITSVETGLAELQDELIATGGVVAEQPSEELFFIDTVGSGSGSTVANRSNASKSKPLKADEIIGARSAVPSVDSRKRRGDGGGSIGSAKRVRKDYVTHKELARLKKVADGHHDDSAVVSEHVFDAWGSGPVSEKEKQNETFTSLVQIKDIRTEVKKAPSSFHQKPISLAANGKSIPALSTPGGGYSYNPSFKDYEARLSGESAKAIAAEQKRLDQEEADRIRTEAAARSAAEAEAAEVRAELSEWDEESEWEGFVSGAEDGLDSGAGGFRGGKKMQERKTPAQRNRIKRRKEEERRKKHEAKTQLKKEQVERIKEIAREVAEKEAAVALTTANEEDEEEEEEGTEDLLRRRQLGKMKLPDKDLELVLPDELKDSLRALKPEGNVLKDRYRSLLVRGRLEVRRRVPFRKQKRTTVTEKWTYKDFTI